EEECTGDSCEGDKEKKSSKKNCTFCKRKLLDISEAGDDDDYDDDEENDDDEDEDDNDDIDVKNIIYKKFKVPEYTRVNHKDNVFQIVEFDHKNDGEDKNDNEKDSFESTKKSLAFLKHSQNDEIASHTMGEIDNFDTSGPKRKLLWFFSEPNADLDGDGIEDAE
ncbi:unnamed protein product, partial [Owenia fusiformis]